MAKSKTKKQRCGGKRRFRDHEEAARALRSQKSNSTRDVICVRSYYCERCKGWHLTSNERWDRTQRAA